MDCKSNENVYVKQFGGRNRQTPNQQSGGKPERPLNFMQVSYNG